MNLLETRHLFFPRSALPGQVHEAYSHTASVCSLVVVSVQAQLIWCHLGGSNQTDICNLCTILLHGWDTVPHVLQYPRLKNDIHIPKSCRCLATWMNEILYIGTSITCIKYKAEIYK